MDFGLHEDSGGMDILQEDDTTNVDGVSPYPSETDSEVSAVLYGVLTTPTVSLDAENIGLPTTLDSCLLSKPYISQYGGNV